MSAKKRQVAENLRVMLEFWEREHLAGDAMALWLAIDLCASANSSLPRWAAEAFQKGFKRVKNLEIGSLDEAFGKPYGGKHLDSLRIDRELTLKVVGRILYLHDHEKIGIGDDLFQRVASEFGIGARQVKRYWSTAGGVEFWGKKR